MFLECTAVNANSTCKVVNGSECWCKQNEPDECPCDDGCSSGWTSGMSARELCGYEEGYEGTYYAANKAVAMAFGKVFRGIYPSCFNNHISRIGLTPLECPDEKSYCANGLCYWKTVKDQWNTKDHCTVQTCCVPVVRCTNMENNV